KIKYFTPIEEVELCGHATISIFSTLRELKLISADKYIAETLAGNLEIVVDKNFIWMDMSTPKIEYIFSLDEIEEIYSAFNLDMSQAPKNLVPKIVNTGLSDIIVPIENKEILDSFTMDKEKVIELSKKYKVVGAHLFTLDKSKKITAFCRNIAPLVGIDEECATGTSNGALTHYLNDYNIISTQDINTFVQGESMGRASTILSKYKEDGKTIQIGGNAVISFECKFYK
ncbi:PhzF family phenazine biosynthesis protein, partial [Fusobacterium nucleatum]|uniref:PhzF family phenazine biosynthesis protein n=2 Tax=Fusobacteriaceae TaxID=203492 RepID=UPI001F51E65A